MQLKAGINRVMMLAAIFSLSLGAAPATGESTKGTVGGPMAGTIGGSFTLVDHNGNTVTDADFRGRFMLVYFGYTYCPDVCPTSLIMMTDALKRMGRGAEKVAPVLITIDPERDIPEHLKEYVHHFHPRLVGLSGSPEQVAVAAEAYKVFYEKVFEEGWGVDEYFVYHSDVVYFMGPDGKYLDHFRSGTTPKVMAKRMKAAM